ncbi:Hsp20/alpha crystallin family protein [Propionimicrobium lymphophilum]|uniref:Hsp20/alpha crystallin family protein n=1 Tax=Propionimicrobium lymphophilum TaxID=33012 RepID=UPI00254B18A6|nr:Hsp20/alpha crystallin family protein [Propionimicrobium lymphophilum]MDK7709743.1 Hsp20/alpha crystallin family protein [Propionimicrobium lymphophilum]MDK7733995.1 Hsp20/alpha crystallin family protein [Propionimicrobium lymphophilum]
MSTTVYNPFREMDRWFNQMNRTSTDRVMPMDLLRDGNEFIVKMDLPGVDPDSIDIDVDDRTLTVRAERKQHEMTTNDEKNQWMSSERSYGSYARQLTLGTGLDLSGIAADYTDGVLTITIPVAEEAKPRKIKVATNSASTQIESGEADK